MYIYCIYEFANCFLHSICFLSNLFVICLYIVKASLAKNFGKTCDSIFVVRIVLLVCLFVFFFVGFCLYF